MKLKCNDGITRIFEVAHGDGDFLSDGTRHDRWSSAHCSNCGEIFGCHDTYILKPLFKAHICKEK